MRVPALAVLARLVVVDIAFLLVVAGRARRGQHQADAETQQAGPVRRRNRESRASMTVPQIERERRSGDHGHAGEAGMGPRQCNDFVWSYEGPCRPAPAHTLVRSDKLPACRFSRQPHVRSDKPPACRLLQHIATSCTACRLAQHVPTWPPARRLSLQHSSAASVGYDGLDGTFGTEYDYQEAWRFSMHAVLYSLVPAVLLLASDRTSPHPAGYLRVTQTE